jgi:2-oxoglutarate ferredoxin oxidoreductase subunit gamma
MNAEIAIAGTGGQGVLVIGRLLAEAGFLEGQEVVWLPSYGAEKRGGTVSCHVTISDEKIGSLVIDRPSCAIAMNQTAVSKLESAMKPSSVLVINRSLAPVKVVRKDIHIIYVSASQIAIKLGNDSAANIVALGALMAGYPVVAKASILRVMDTMFARNPKALELNKLAFQKGYSCWSARQNKQITNIRNFAKNTRLKMPNINFQATPELPMPRRRKMGWQTSPG